MMELKKNNLHTLSEVSKTNQSQIFDWDIIVPDSKPDVLEIINTDGTVTITGKEIMQDRAVLNGNVRISILYIASKDDKCIKAIENIQPFNFVLELKDIRQNMILDLNCKVNKISSDLINSRKINTSCLLDFSGVAFYNNEMSFIDSIDSCDIVGRKEHIVTQKIKECFFKKILFDDNIEVPVGKPSIMELLKIKYDFINKEVKFVNNRIVLRGAIRVTTVYLCNTDSDCTQYMVNEIPVNEVVECNGVNEDIVCDYDVLINNFNYMLKGDGDSEIRTMKICGDIALEGKIYDEIDISPVVDAYSLCSEINVTKNIFAYDEILNDFSGKITIKDNILLDNKNEIQKVLLMNTSEKIDSIKYSNGKISIKGNLLCGFLYASQEDLVCFENKIIPFEHAILCDIIKEKIIFDIKTENVSFSYNIISASEIEVRVNIEYKIKVKCTVQKEIVEDIEVANEDMKKNINRGITVFFCDKDEKLWDIAKKYKKTVDDIVMINELEDYDIVKKGTKIIIP